MSQVLMADFIAGVSSGNLASFPTDTVPALAVIPECAQLIFTAKQRSQTKPLILMGATASDLWQFATGSGSEWEIWQQVAALYWPGAITLILPASERVPPGINPTNSRTIGLRVPNCAIAQKILSQTGPLATTSANLSGQAPLQTMTEIAAMFPDVLTLLPTELAATDSVTGVPSTVIKWTGNGWKILRQGAVKFEL